MILAGFQLVSFGFPLDLPFALWSATHCVPVPNLSAQISLLQTSHRRLPRLFGSFFDAMMNSINSISIDLVHNEYTNKNFVASVCEFAAHCDEVTCRNVRQCHVKQCGAMICTQLTARMPNFGTPLKGVQLVGSCKFAFASFKCGTSRMCSLKFRLSKRRRHFNRTPFFEFQSSTSFRSASVCICESGSTPKQHTKRTRR